MTIADFYDDVRDAIGRGTSIDTRLPLWAQQTINGIENRNTFLWQRRMLEWPAVPGVDGNRIDLGVSSIKAFNWVRWGVQQGAGSGEITFFGDPLTIVDPIDFVSIDQGYARAAYLDGADTLVLDAQPQQAGTLFGSVWVFTQWEEDYDEDDTPPVLVRHYEGFKNRFMMVAAQNLRDDRLAAIWSGTAQESLLAMIGTDTDSEWRARRGLAMGQRSRR